MEQEHIVTSFDDELKAIDTTLAEMGGMAEAQLAKAIDALVRRDSDLARQVIKEDKLIDDLEAALDHNAIRLIALRQPMAEDLRMVITALKTSANIERIGDYSKNIAKRAITLAQTEPVGDTVKTIKRMSILAQELVSSVLDAYVKRDIRAADDVRRRDAEVDRIHTGLFREMLTHMIETPHNITACTHLLFIAKNIERIGDHATNIAEYVHFMVSGQMPEDERPKDDETSQTIVTAPIGKG
ncbi:MAG TPA: phosphate signaling complex protein PhoU [Rhodospirillales bacterium]|nr:phosphate signaling complex protein PhoU [Rhodospirillales bacterium]